MRNPADRNKRVDGSLFLSHANESISAMAISACVLHTYIYNIWAVYPTRRIPPPPPFKSPASARNPPSLSTKEKNSPRRIAATSIKPQTATEKKLKPNDKSRHRGPWHSAQQCHIDPIRTNCCKQRANRIKSRIHQNPLSGLFVFCLPAPDCVSRGQQLLSIANDHCFASLPPILSAPFPLKSTYLCHWQTNGTDGSQFKPPGPFISRMARRRPGLGRLNVH